MQLPKAPKVHDAVAESADAAAEGAIVAAEGAYAVARGVDASAEGADCRLGVPCCGTGVPRRSVGVPSWVAGTCKIWMLFGMLKQHYWARMEADRFANPMFLPIRSFSWLGQKPNYTV